MSEIKEEWKSLSTRVGESIEYHKGSLNQDVLVPIRFLVDSKQVSLMTAWSKAAEWMNFLADKTKSVYPTYNIGVISSFESIKSINLTDRIGNGDPYVEMEQFFTRRFLQSHLAVDYITAIDSLSEIKAQMNNYLPNLEEAYDLFKQHYPLCTEQDIKMDELCYPNFELVVSVKLEDRGYKLKEIVEAIKKDLPACFQIQKVDYNKYERLSSYEQIIQSNAHTLLIPMVNTLNNVNRNLCKSSTGCLYNVPKYLMSSFRDLAKLRCKIKEDDRRYYINPEAFKLTKGNKGFYNCVDNFKKGAYKKLICDKICEGKAPKTDFNYILVEEEQISNSNSCIFVLCFICDHIWPVRISSHVTDEQRDCPSCKHHVPYTLDIFLLRAREIYGDQYNYINNRPEDIKTNNSNIKFICKKCNQPSTMSIRNHINNGGGCPVCGQSSWYPQRINIEGTRMHGGIYSYHLIEEGVRINSMETHLPIFCKKCEETWYPTINSHIIHRKGCPICRNSKGEQAVRVYLKEQNITPDTQFVIQQPLIGKSRQKRYDFKIVYNGRSYIIEFDGKQHFNFSPHFQKDEAEFRENQQTDIHKTRVAIDNGYFIIRIDYTQLKDVGQHIYEAIVNTSSNPANKYYFSNPQMYTHIIDTLS